MPTRKIKETEAWQPKKPCYDPDHEVANMRVFEPGTYEHECPSCGKKKIFTVSGIMCSLTPTEVDQGLYVLGNVYQHVDGGYFAESPLNSGILRNRNPRKTCTS